MSDFDKIVSKTLQYEGKLSDVAQDHGGLTKYGITQVDYPDVDIANLTLEQAIAIYKRDYFDKLHLDLLPNVQIQFKVFDISVNMGRGRVTQFLQTIVNVDADGDFGSVTQAAIAAYTAHPQWAKNMMLLLVALQTRKYCGIVYTDPTQQKFLAGWLTRARDEGKDLTA